MTTETTPKVERIANPPVPKPTLPNMPSYDEAIELTRQNVAARAAERPDELLSAEHYQPARPYYTLINGCITEYR